jgi:hypothetical protein
VLSASYAFARKEIADVLVQLREHACAAGCDKIATLDRALSKDESFVAP